MALAVALVTVGSSACQSKPPREGPAGDAGSAATTSRMELLFTYGSEKESWVKEATAAFNQEQRRTSAGRTIEVSAVAMGSGECIDELLAGRRQAHLTSPASAAFITLGNAQSRAKIGRDLIGPTESLVLSPVVIAMWKPMAEAIGWGTKPVGWADVLALARTTGGWRTRGFPQWGDFRFGHTHPQYSNSGLISVLAEIYAAVGKTAGLTIEDVRRPRVGEFVADIERSVVHYGSSTGFFGREMFANGPSYLSAAVLYENMVIEAASRKDLVMPVVAVYPKEGTFWSDHPVGIVERDWVTPEHREAAKAYMQFLLARPRQERAMTYGFRPASVEVALTAPIDAAHGVDPREPKTTLEVPGAGVINAVLDVWQANKKRAEVVLVLDTSGSMQEDQKLAHARDGAVQFISLLGDEDTFTLVPFSTSVVVPGEALRVRDGRPQAVRQVESLFPGGKTALYDAIDTAYQRLASKPRTDRIQAVVVLTDGADTDSRLTLPELLARVRADGENRTIRVFTISYGKEAKRDVLASIAEATHARSYEGNPQTIVGVFKDISTFF